MEVIQAYELRYLHCQVILVFVVSLVEICGGLIHLSFQLIARLTKIKIDFNLINILDF